MRSKVGSGSIIRAVLVVALLMGVVPAKATITYNYAQDWMFDSASGLYWQVLPIPSATFVPASGAIATNEQLNVLSIDAGLGPEGLLGVFDPQPTAYSPQIANLLSFFQADAPAKSPNLLRSLDPVVFYRALNDTIPGNSFEYTYLSYTPVDGSSSTWLYSALTTLGDYGPELVCPGIDNCPPTEPGFVVSNVQPVPLPAALWLMFSGMGVLGAGTLRHRRMRA